MVKTINRNINRKLFNEAKKVIPGGVNSPVRSFSHVGGHPIFSKKGAGSYLWDEQGKKYIDYCLCWGALILGHAHPGLLRVLKSRIDKGTGFGTATEPEIVLAKLIVEALPSIEQVRLVNSGTEAVMSAVRLGRAYTKRKKIIKFEGSYHGHADHLLVKAGSGLATLGLSDSCGVPQDFAKHTIVIPFNNAEVFKSTIKKYKDDLAAVIVEPVAANCGLIPPGEEFLETLRELTRKHNIVLIFDEVITGFRLGLGGAQEFFGIKPDLTCLGKIIGAGLPIGAFGGPRKIMKLLAPTGGVYQAGTLSGNPISVTAGIFTLETLKKLNPYKSLESKTKKISLALKSAAEKNNIDLKVNHIGSMFSLFFTKKEVIDHKTAKTQNLDLFRRFFKSMLSEGVYLSPSGFETNFLSIAHSNGDIEKTIKIFEETLKKLRRKKNDKC